MISASEAFEDLAAAYGEEPGVARRRMFGRDGLSRDGRFFAFLDKRGLVLKLPPATRTALVDAGDATTAEAVSPSMRKTWAIVPYADDPQRWRALTAEAFEHARP
ncbi:hypothetical protein E1293_14730 [Actinomadura darangshiensis]|uniref:TfoX N-terminal domain-containing protein n=1 Tax=Actinomadura darangshiensis TaxID=705336 RepID=A0A4R5BDS0_9ACTN|nr:TfoX/Sxy family protein [Actinomadura darangshiensis]TDD83419.1 hypothetical protein E1293_14730 [Actinomadura darangshiensis]